MRFPNRTGSDKKTENYLIKFLIFILRGDKGGVFAGGISADFLRSAFLTAPDRGKKTLNPNNFLKLNGFGSSVEKAGKF